MLRKGGPFAKCGSKNLVSGGLSQGKLGSLGAKPLGKFNIWEMFSCKVNISFKIIFARAFLH